MMTEELLELLILLRDTGNYIKGTLGFSEMQDS